MGRNGMHIGFWRESQKGRDQQEDADVGGWIIQGVSNFESLYKFIQRIYTTL
jgi:hypothetical protein